MNSWLCVAEALKKHWRSPIYSFFKIDSVAIQYDDGRMFHFFPCVALKCKAVASGVWRFQDSKDKSSTANLKHLAIRCFGEEAVKSIITGRAQVTQSRSTVSSPFLLTKVNSPPDTLIEHIPMLNSSKSFTV